MKKSLWLGAGVLSLALAACGSDPEPERVDANAADEAEDEPEEEEKDEAETEKPEEKPKLTGITSDYTKYDLDACDILSSESVEGESVEALCKGYGGVPLYVNVGDGRFDIDVGVTGRFDTISPFNELNDTIEWRLKDGKPFAVIARLKDVSMETGGASALMVETVGEAGKPGCRVAHVWNSRAKQNETAREIADETLADDFTCPNEPRRVD